MAPPHHTLEGSPSVDALDVAVDSRLAVGIHDPEMVVLVTLDDWDVAGASAAAGSKAK
jgi:hypothetical protein